MKKIILVRHGKAEDLSQDLDDFERSLTLRGKKTSRLMAQRLKDKESSVGIFITSPAFRALETALIFAREFRTNPANILLDNNLYSRMGFGYLTELLQKADKETDSIILFGHNPSFTDTAVLLSKDGCGMLPKSGVIGISFNIKSWTDLQRHTGKIEYFLKPEKEL